MTTERRYRRLLRWYPRSWREQNEQVVLGTMLDDADRSGRTAPSATERLSVIGHGLGIRLDARLASVAALASLAVVAVAGSLTVWATSTLAAAGMSWVLPVLTVTVVPSLAIVGWISLARQRGLVSDPRAVVVAIVSAAALVAAGLAQIAWGAAFQAAEEGVAATGVSRAWPWLVAGGCALGAIAIALFVDALLRRSQMSRSGSAALAGVVGAVLAPMIGAALISPYTGTILAGALALAVTLPRRTRRADPAPAAPPRPPVVTRTRRLARALAILAAAASALGVLYALTGSRWGPATDATAAMGDGIAIALLAALPLIAATGLLVGARGRVPRQHTWGPLLLVALAAGTVAIAYQGAPSWNRMFPGFAVASGLVGAAIAWWLAPRIGGRARVIVAVLLGVAFAAILGIVVMPTLAFVVPVLAIAFAIWAPRRTAPGRLPPPHTEAAVNAG